ncbi:MAG: phosphonate C-P lyase system protein PhnL [Deltaproteobacteria bacterium]|jgi:alpha-D-ribose 1-methylphosphonate 5-triphosphate synthase subunit PhnL|nr:phosphonate C-P lyase system protein PhnL [Deltaproteobacteria bacterium]
MGPIRTGDRKPIVPRHESQNLEKRQVEAMNLEIMRRESMRLKYSNNDRPDAGLPCRRPPIVRPAAGNVPSPMGEATEAVPTLAASPSPRLGPGEMVRVGSLSKTFVLHLSGPAILRALEDVSFTVHSGECLAVTGPSGSGKSSLLRCVYGNYLPSSGEILIRDGLGAVSLREAGPRDILGLRLRSLGYVSQFLRVIPRVSALEVVAEPLVARGCPPDIARAEASELLGRLHVPRRLQALPPATFSGGERQRVNLARGLVWPAPILLLDEPTASLDQANKMVVCELIREAKKRGAAVIGVFHDREVLSLVSDAIHDLRPPLPGGPPRPPSGGQED